MPPMPTNWTEGLRSARTSARMTQLLRDASFEKAGGVEEPQEYFGLWWEESRIPSECLPVFSFKTKPLREDIRGDF